MKESSIISGGCTLSMRFRWKSYIFIPFLTIFYLCGCYAPPAFKPITVVKPPRKVEPYIISQLDRYFVRDWKYVVIHHSIGICLVGNFNESYPTAAQMASLSALVGYLQDRCHITSENIIMHRHFRETECPGRNFPYYKVLAKTVRW